MEYKEVLSIQKKTLRKNAETGAGLWHYQSLQYRISALLYPCDAKLLQCKKGRILTMKKLFFLCLLFSVMLFCMACGQNGTTPDSSDSTGNTPEHTDPAGSDTADTTAADTTADTQPFTEAEHIRLVTEGEVKATVSSLHHTMEMTLTRDESGAFSYALTAGDVTVLNPSGLELTLNQLSLTGARPVGLTAKRQTAEYSFLGNFSTLQEDCVVAELALEKEGYRFYLDIKLYDDGVAFRYRLPATGTARKMQNEGTTFALPAFSKVYCGIGSDCYESQIQGYTYNTIPVGDKLNGPMTFELSDGQGYLVLMEGSVPGGYIGTNFVSTGRNRTFAVSGSWTKGQDFEAFSTSGEIRTGWRIVNYSKDLNGIVTNNIVYHTALDIDGRVPDHGDTSYVTPGKCTWSWINDRGVPFAPQINYTLNAARLGFAYNIIDEGYPSWTDYENCLLRLGRMGEELGVRQILWCYATGGHNGYRINSIAQARTIMKKIAGLHLAGIKFDFFDPETKTATLALQRAALQYALDNRLVVNFHGCAKPTGLSVEFPNELSREGVRGLENMARNDILSQARFYTHQFYTRYLAGHADFTPDVNTAMQIAALVALDSPLTVIATDPADMMKNPALEMIKAIPTVWDRTILLDGRIGSYISVAKEKDGVWYVGGIASSAQRSVTVDLSFLDEGNYFLTCFVDKSTTAKKKVEKVVTRDDVVTFSPISAGCGYVMQLTKLSLSQYGGEITDQPIKVTVAEENAVVRYTTDGSDPRTSATAMTVTNGKILLTDSCDLKVTLIPSHGSAATLLSYRFNRILYNGVDASTAYGDNSTTLTLSATYPGAVLHYTVDGSLPTADAPVYRSPLKFLANTTVSVVAIAPDGSVSEVHRYDVKVRKAITSALPDIFLGKDYKEAVSGWDNRIYVDRSMNDTVLSLGGTNASNGTKFDHGISTNAIGYFVYAIPEGATGFIGIAGIDDSVYNNTADGHKGSITCSITVDGKLLYTTDRLAPGDFEVINVALPEGAKEIRIDFGDAGDGITCDNADLVNAGFIMK